MSGQAHVDITPKNVAEVEEAVSVDKHCSIHSLAVQFNVCINTESCDAWDILRGAPNRSNKSYSTTLLVEHLQFYQTEGSDNK